MFTPYEVLIKCCVVCLRSNRASITCLPWFVVSGLYSLWQFRPKDPKIEVGGKTGISLIPNRGEHTTCVFF